MIKGSYQLRGFKNLYFNLSEGESLYTLLIEPALYDCDYININGKDVKIPLLRTLHGVRDYALINGTSCKVFRRIYEVGLTSILKLEKELENYNIYSLSLRDYRDHNLSDYFKKSYVLDGIYQYYEDDTKAYVTLKNLDVNIKLMYCEGVAKQELSSINTLLSVKGTNVIKAQGSNLVARIKYELSGGDTPYIEFDNDDVLDITINLRGDV